MRFFYNLGIQFYRFAIQLAAIFGNEKARLWINGRKDIFSKLATIEKNTIWIHAASLGEFEQGRPLIEAIKSKYSNEKILLTFFSPSGYEIRKNYPLADYIFYLPLDTKRNAKQFIEITQPKLAIFIKYEFWQHHLEQLYLNKIPIYSVSTLFRPKHFFFKWYGKPFQKVLYQFNHFFVQNTETADLLKSIGVKNVTKVGDTRIDRVWDIKEKAKQFPIIEQFTKNQLALIGGSTWQPDEAIIARYINQQQTLDFKTIIAPHDIQTKHIEQIEALFDSKVKVQRYSNCNTDLLHETDVLIIDNIGMLSSIYQYGAIAYIGGGFGAGIHNTLEPIAFGLPVIFGEKYHKFEEAVWLLREGGGFSIEHFDDFTIVFEKLQDEKNYQSASKAAFQYITQNRGATQKVLSELEV